MPDIRDIQAHVDSVFRQHFGVTPLTVRLEDIGNEATELRRYVNVANLKEEAGDLLASTLQLCTEAGWHADELIAATLEKIARRGLQYQTLGRKMRVAVLGGAFDPPHLGHLRLAQLVLKLTKQDEVWLTPCFKHLGGKTPTEPHHRLEMLKRACAVDLRLKPFDYEIKHQLAGETYHFINRLKHDPEFDNYQFSYVISQDNANTFHEWYKSEELERLIPFIVCSRKGFPRDKNVNWYLKPPHVYINDEDTLEIGSRDIRPYILRSPEKIKDYINWSVVRYIQQNDLYKQEE